MATSRSILPIKRVPLGRTALLRFFVKVKRPAGGKGCWIWEGGHVQSGHGRFVLEGRLYLPHRIAYRQFRGPIRKGQLVLHRCDNGACVNPAHLFLGSQRDNMQDAARKGRLRNKRRPT